MNSIRNGLNANNGLVLIPRYDNVGSFDHLGVGKPSLIITRPNW